MGISGPCEASTEVTLSLFLWELFRALFSSQYCLKYLWKLGQRGTGVLPFSAKATVQLGMACNWDNPFVHKEMCYGFSVLRYLYLCVFPM